MSSFYTLGSNHLRFRKLKKVDLFNSLGAMARPASPGLFGAQESWRDQCPHNGRVFGNEGTKCWFQLGHEPWNMSLPYLFWQPAGLTITIAGPYANPVQNTQDRLVLPGPWSWIQASGKQVLSLSLPMKIGLGVYLWGDWIFMYWCRTISEICQVKKSKMQ